MVEIIMVSVVAFLVAILTFFSGFGLGTILTPVFMLFFPVDVAIALTGVVHFFNNLFKLILVGKNADKSVLIRFGIPAVLAALVGSWLLINLPNQEPLFQYVLMDKLFEVFPVKLLIAVLLLLFAMMELIPFFQSLQFSQNKLPFGGFLSGFFGGLSGNQGALRTAFLIKAGLSKEAFIGTAVVVSTFVDFTRLSVYSTQFFDSNILENWPVVLSATTAGILGSFIGNKLLKKITLHFLQITVAVMLIVLSIALGLGWL
ncbi:MAG: sulfite exporter TauE/SafE family protein [Saprospiraceae bacterium]